MLKSSRKLEISSHNVSHDILFLENCCVCCVLFSLGKTFVWTEDIIPVKKIGENLILLPVSHNYAPYRCWVTSCICKHQTSIQVFSKLKYTTTYICSWQVVHTLVYAWSSGIYLVTSNSCVDIAWAILVILNDNITIIRINPQSKIYTTRKSKLIIIEL